MKYFLLAFFEIWLSFQLSDAMSYMPDSTVHQRFIMLLTFVMYVAVMGVVANQTLK